MTDPAAPPRVVVELCVDDLDGALVADRAGVERIELCADLVEGGTTPSVGLVRSALRAVRHVGVQVIVRPRGGDFAYDDGELDVMCADLEAIVELALAASAGNGNGNEGRTEVGVVLGALTAASEVDVPAMRRLVAAAGPLPVTFHKAIDATPDLLAAYDVLHSLGVRRVLTAGGPGTAAEGAEVLAELVRRSAASPDAPEVLVGGGVRAAGVRDLLDATGASSVHLRAMSPSPRGDGTLRTDPAVVAEFLAAVGRRAGDPAAVDLVDAADASAAQHAGGAVPGPAPSRSAVVAVDIGGTSFKGAVVDDSGRTVLSLSVAAGSTGEESIDLVVGLLHELRAAARASGHDVVGVGVVTPGMVDAERGIVLFASTLGWTDVPLGPILSAELGVPVEIDHDVRTSGLAESLFGASAGVADSVLVAVGTGVAASITSGGHAVRGALTAAGELGHVPAVPGGEACTCGQHGCLEVYLSGAGVARRYAALGGEPGLDTAAVVARVGRVEGVGTGVDAIADRVWADGVRALALGLTSLTLLVDPAVIVLAGGVSRAGATLVDPLRAELAAGLAWRAAPEVRLSELGTHGGRIGAAVLAFRAGGRGSVVDSWSRADLLAD
ncbi:ROK family protein [Frigoribacterium sp. ACAM 257]|uniref:copper homeostasis protein CutC n=1 Tax=Frigoribacterium sp. ACAM 257 TaxID=2508998 RepID=UPI0011B966A6|nr:copper homeostasis protein CutC [Frigoribacterium sp. ACAM 257]TWX38553.1 ROK family protein [Frigoribacterium sp. ACAM 257]